MRGRYELATTTQESILLTGRQLTFEIFETGIAFLASKNPTLMLIKSPLSIPWAA
jgi:hypothetical protein